MRPVAIGLLALAGCNQIFGLDELPGLPDAAAPPDGAFPRVRVQYQVADTELMAPEVIASPTLSLAPLPTGTTFRIDDGNGTLGNASYDFTSGELEVPIADPFTKRWKFELTLPGEAPREVSWTPNGDTAAFVIPVVGRLDRGTMPANAGFDIEPVGTIPAPPALGGYQSSHVFLTGVFVDSATGATPSQAELAFDATFDGKELGVPIGNPDASRGDYAILVDYDFDGAAPCSVVSRGFAGFLPPTLVTGAQVAATPQPTWIEPNPINKPFEFKNLGVPDLALRVKAAVVATDTQVSNVQLGLVANGNLPAFTNKLAAAPSPLLFPLATCRLLDPPQATSATFIVPADLADYPLVTVARLTDARMIDGVQLVSSIVTVDRPAGVSTTIDFGVPFAKAFTLGVGGDSFPIGGGGDDVMVNAGTGTLDLGFDLEAEQAALQLAVDYVEVTVFEIVNGTLVPKRIYVTTDLALIPATRTLANPIKIDRSLFESGMKYALQIQTFRGRPDAEKGGFERVEYPQAVATNFTRTILSVP